MTRSKNINFCNNYGNIVLCLKYFFECLMTLYCFKSPFFEKQYKLTIERLKEKLIGTSFRKTTTFIYIK